MQGFIHCVTFIFNDLGSLHLYNMFSDCYPSLCLVLLCRSICFDAHHLDFYRGFSIQLIVSRFKTNCKVTTWMNCLTHMLTCIN